MRIEVMKTFFFLIQNSWKYTVHNWYNSMVMLIALALGLVFPMTALNDVNDLRRDGQVAKYAEPSKVAIMEYSMKYREESELYAAFSMAQDKGWFEEAGFLACMGQIIYAGEEAYSGGVSGISREYLELSAYELLKGEIFSNEEYEGVGDKNCLLVHSGTLARSGVGVDDRIEILGESYRVKGIVRIPRGYGGVLVPYVCAEEVLAVSNGNLQYQIIAYGENLGYPESMARQLLSYDDGKEGIIVAQTGTVQEETYYTSIQKVNRYRLTRALYIVVAAILNVSLLFIGTIVRERYGLAVRITLGAERRMLQMEVFVRGLFLIAGAILIAVFLYPAVATMLMGAVGVLYGTSVWQVALGGVILFSVIQYIVLRFCFRRWNITALLKK